MALSTASHVRKDVRREALIAACDAELQNSKGLHQLADYVRAHIDDIIRLLQPRTATDALRVEAARALQLVGPSPAASRLRFDIERLSHHPRTTLLLVGEAGTGRRHCARLLHAATFPNGELIELEARRLPEVTRLLSLSREPGSARAAGMTIYIRELWQAPPAAQRRLAKLLEDSALPARIMASLTVHPSLSAHERGLRPELAVHFTNELSLPPLCHRSEDVPALASHFAERICAHIPGVSFTLNHAALELLKEHSWPGNIAELERLVRHFWARSGPGSDDFAANDQHPPSAAGELLLAVRSELARALQARLGLADSSSA